MEKQMLKFSFPFSNIHEGLTSTNVRETRAVTTYEAGEAAASPEFSTPIFFLSNQIKYWQYVHEELKFIL